MFFNAVNDPQWYVVQVCDATLPDWVKQTGMLIEIQLLVNKKLLNFKHNGRKNKMLNQNALN